MWKSPMPDELFAREIARVRALQEQMAGEGTRFGPLARRLQAASLAVLLWVLREWWIVNAVVWLAVMIYSLMLLDGVEPPTYQGARRAP